MPFNDLREFIAKLEEEGELALIKQEVDWNLEAGAISRVCIEKRVAAPLFENLKGYPDGYRVLGDPLGTIRRLAIGLERPILPYGDMYRDLMKLWSEAPAHPIKPRIVSSGPCKENICKGDEVNLYKFPSLMLHDGDGGRYIGSLHTVVTKDLDTPWVNWGCYRLMIHNKNHMGGYIAPTNHAATIFRKYEARNEPMPFAVAIGTDPAVICVSVSPFPHGVSEAEIAGAMRQKPVDVVKCETVDLMVPSTSEIVIEGHVIPNLRVDEGPFGEFSGYRASPRAPRYVYKVDCITHRNNPILTSVAEGVPVTTGHLVSSIADAGIMVNDLRDAGLPVVDVNVLPEGACFLAVVSTKTPYPGIASRIAAVMWGSKAGVQVPKIIVTNDDVDIYDQNEVIHAFATKCHPVRGTHAYPDSVGHPLLPYMNLEERLWAKGCSALYDCTWPVDWPLEIAVPPRASFNDLYPKHIQERVISNWEKYGFATNILKPKKT